MHRYVIATDVDGEDEPFTTGVILGVEEARSPKEAVVRCCCDVVNDKLVEMLSDDSDDELGGTTEEDADTIVNIARWVLTKAAGDGEVVTFSTYRVDEFTPEEEIQIPSPNSIDTSPIKLE